MRKLATTLALTAAIGAATALPASAHHAHVRHVGQDEACVVVAPEGGESHVTLPSVIFDLGITSDPVGGADHPLHVLVHKGQANDFGAGSTWQLLTSNDCGGYVNWP